MLTGGGRVLGLPLLAALMLLASPAASPEASAQARPRRPVTAPRDAVACAGEIVAAIEILVHRPSTAGAATDAWDKASELTGIRFPVTRDRVVRAFLQVHEGRPCTETRRAESERLLRAQPFVASAAIKVRPEGPGRVTLQVEVVEEVPFVGGAGVSHGTLSALALGTQNLDGRGLFTALSYQRGFVYRDAYGVRLVQRGAFGRPDVVSIDAAREKRGGHLILEVAEPFLTELQRHAFHAGRGSVTELAELVPPAGDAVALYTHRNFWNAGVVTRIGPPTVGRTVGVIGALLLGENIRTSEDVVRVTDDGLVAAPDSALAARFPAYAVARVTAIAGVRRLRYLTVTGFDALRARQDMGIGVQVGLLAGPSVWSLRGARDVLLASDVYAGAGNSASFVAVRVLTETRGHRAPRAWQGSVSSARLSWYRRVSPAWTTTMTIDGAALHDLSFPAQLSLRDADGGVRGFGESAASGGTRLVSRVEHRLALPGMPRRTAMSVAVFADAGKLWAGDVPYGGTTPVRGAVGVSLLGAYPAGSMRTLRVDLAVPVNPARGESRLELRFSSADRTLGVWREPRDVTAARTGAMPATLLRF